MPLGQAFIGIVAGGIAGLVVATRGSLRHQQRDRGRERFVLHAIGALLFVAAVTRLLSAAPAASISSASALADYRERGHDPAVIRDAALCLVGLLAVTVGCAQRLGASPGDGSDARLGGDAREVSMDAAGDGPDGNGDAGTCTCPDRSVHGRPGRRWPAASETAMAPQPDR